MAPQMEQIAEFPDKWLDAVLHSVYVVGRCTVESRPIRMAVTNA